MGACSLSTEEEARVRGHWREWCLGQRGCRQHRRPNGQTASSPHRQGSHPGARTRDTDTEPDGGERPRLHRAPLSQGLWGTGR